MKKIVIFCAALLVSGCCFDLFDGVSDKANEMKQSANEMKKTASKFKKTAKDVKNVATAGSKFAKSAEKRKEQMERLAKMTPLTTEEIKSWIPEKLDDLKRTKFEIVDMGKLVAADTVGKQVQLIFKDGQKSVNFQVVDGAGAGGPMLVQFWTGMSLVTESEDDTKRQTTQTRDGFEVVEIHYFKTNTSDLRFVVGERIYVQLNASGMDPDEAWGYAQKLDVKKLMK